ncbi:MAG: hypothetical protein AB1586_13625 [Pseudomonadota bacterium]
MRSDIEFVASYRKALALVDPATEEMGVEEVRALAQTELCLAFVERYIPDERLRSVPFLMMGYPNLLDDTVKPEARGAMAALRHLCSRFGSVSAWLDATAQYARTPATIRCHDVAADRAKRRAAAPRALVEQIDLAFGGQVPWSSRKLRIADPGEATFTVDHGRTKLIYRVPAVVADQENQPRHDLSRRGVNPPIKIGLQKMLEVAERVDAREAQADWPKESLPPLRLVERLRKLKPEDVSGFFDGKDITLDGAVHVVGMLSSGKSTLVLGLLLSLTLGGSGKRIAVLSTDTIQGAVLAARLRHHGVKATVLASLRNREKHLNAIYWQRGLDPTGWSLSSLGDLSEGFSTACPLDGMQQAPEIAEGAVDARARYPKFTEKQCHNLKQRAAPDGGDEQEDIDDVGDNSQTRSCPLWMKCPAQEQQRDFVDAQVTIMTPQAFVHITPDKWTTDRHVTIPELLQYTADLVIVDEVDGVQKVFDDIFAPRSPIMGDAPDVYAPSIGLRSSGALRDKSGAQFRKPVNTKWQSNFYVFFRLIGTIYAILQNEREALTAFYENTPFTAGSILYELWRRRMEASDPSVDLTFDNPEYERQFLEIIKVAGAIRHYSSRSSVSEDGDEEDDAGAGPKFADPEFADAAEALQEVARQILVADYYESLLDEIGENLDGRLKILNAIDETGTPRKRLDRRSNALALLLATVTDLALSHYNWLIKTQPAVARDFDIDEGHLLGRTNSLLKHYRTLLPSNPAGAAFGLFYDEPANDSRTMGGKLTLITHLGVGRHLLTHLHDLLAAEGQAGPHVLMLSGTSWAGGSARRQNPKTKRPMDTASPSFDVQVPVKGVLRQPDAELEAIGHSVFSLVNVKDQDGRQIRISGMNQKDRRANLSAIAERFATRRDGMNRFESDWFKAGERWRGWSETALVDRRRSLLVTNSYADAAIVAESLAAQLEANGYAGWKVFCVVPDRADDEGDVRLLQARRMPRSLIERFGLEQENSVIVAPVQIVGRGHNILNREGRAAISTIYFLHRLHPRPDDLAPTIGRLNRFAQERFDKGVRSADGMSARARRMRYAATNLVKQSLERGRFGYRSLPAEFKAQFAWDLLTPIWQTVGRGIRGGSPVFVGFVDYAFAPHSFDAKEGEDSGDSSVLVQCLHQLEQAMTTGSDESAREVAKLLYEPFHDALAKTEGLRRG